ncbi:unnamed protein product [Candidula unifasciata]|uniref:Uncharacterized protein n=1 Tax=Candidula unifasciata TaxID=100452 RepID=A0A8S3YMW0_9EUPU|nr:unnamed protein product [Candidula unifasciata]
MSISILPTTGTGTNLYIQNGTTPESSILIPSTLSEAQQSAWSQGQCIPYMGIHFYYNITFDMSCDQLFPVVILYNKGQLNTFAWMFLSVFQDKRYEVSPKKVFPFFISPVPKCMDSFDFLTTQHVYLTDDITLNKC